MARLKKTILHFEVNDSEFNIKYNGSLTEPKTKEQRKHNERLMKALLADDVLLTFFYNIVNPVVRCKRREARRVAKADSKTGSTQG